jgi:hypothetical protein
MPGQDEGMARGGRLMAEPNRRSAAVPNDLEAFWVPFTPNRAFKRAPRLIARAKDMQYYTPEGRSHPAPGRGARLRAGVPVRAPEIVRAGEPDRGAGARRSRPRILLQFRLGGGRYGAEDCARVS